MYDESGLLDYYLDNVNSTLKLTPYKKKDIFFLAFKNYYIHSIYPFRYPKN